MFLVLSLWPAHSLGSLWMAFYADRGACGEKPHWQEERAVVGLRGYLVTKAVTPGQLALLEVRPYCW